MSDRGSDERPDPRRLAAAATELDVSRDRAEESGVSATTEPEAPPGEPDENDLSPGTTLGRYVVLARVGAGGVGVVYLAYDPELDRKVALKLLAARAGKRVDAKDARARLVREARAMAKLSHPNVVTVHDVGSFGDRVFLAMEFIEGQTLGAWLKAQPRRWREIVAVFADAGRGLAAAHAAGFIHRDFKPENVMIAAEDGSVRVMDFGLVRGLDEVERSPVPQDSAARMKVEEHVRESLHSKLSSESMTRTGRTMGTPAYMSPEQHVALDLDPRSDQFSFCVALYEALYGYRPFRGDTLPVLANAVITGRVEPPPRGARAPSYLRKAVLRGLSVRREERHPSMQALVDAIARDPRRRLRRWLLVLALVLLAVLAALVVDRRRDRNAQLCADGPARLVGVWDDARREAIAAAFLASGQPYAQDTLTRVEARIDAYARAWQEARATACLDTRVHGVASEALLDLRMRCYDRRLAELRALTAALADADALAVESAVDVVRGLPALAACADAEALTAAVPLPEDPALQAAIAAVDDELAEIYATTALGRYHEASERIAALADRARALEHAPLVARVLAQQASVLSALGEYAAAERVDLEAAEYAARGREDDVLVRVWSQLVTLVGDELARPEEGIVYAGVARAAAARAGNKPWDERRVATAEGTLLYTLGRYEQAVVAYRRALELDRALEAEDDPEIARGMNNLANALDDMGEHAEAVDYYRRALAIFERALGPGHPDVSKNLVNLGSALEQLGRSAEALPHYQRALEINERVFGVDHLWIANPHCHIGLALAALGRDEAATSHLEKALAVWERELGAEHPLLAYALVGLGQIARRDGALDRADALLLRALALRRAGLGEAHPEVAETLGELAEVAVERGDFTQALAHLGEALTIAERELSPHHHKLARLRLLEARALWGDERGAGDPIARDRARRSAARAREALRAGGRDATDVERWIAAHP